MSSLQRPPAWAERWVARWATGSAAGPSVAGDLWEEWSRLAAARGPSAANRWYVRQALAISARYALGRVLDTAVRLPGDLAADIRHAVRGLLRSPGLFLVATLSLGGGLGLTTAVYTSINGLLFAPLPWPGGEHLVDVDLQHPEEVCAGCSGGASYPAFAAWEGRVDAFDALGAMSGSTVLLTGPAGAERVSATAVSSAVAQLLGVRADRGRLFTEAEHSAAERVPVAVVSAAVWSRRFGDDAPIEDAVLNIDGVLHDVVGVLPASARLLDRGEVWRPLEPAHRSDALDQRDLWVFGRLSPETDRGTVASSVTAVHAGQAGADPTVDDRWSARVVPMRSALLGEVGDPAFAWALLGAAAAVLLIACLNLTALLLARVTDRVRELQIRAALGAGAARLARLVLVETALVAGCGAVLGLGVTFAARWALVTFLGWALPPWVAFPVDLRVLGFGVGGAGLAAIACGWAPAVRATRGRAANLHPGGAATAPGSILRRHRLLLGLQVALGVALVASTALAVRSFQRVSDFDGLGYRWEGIAGVHVVADPDRFGTPGERSDFRRRAEESFQAHPAVSAVTTEARVFIGSWGSADGPSPMHIEGRPDPVPDRIVPRHSLGVTEGYFDVFDIRILRGRPIDARDGPGAERVAIVNQAAADLLWPGADPLGGRFSIANGTIEGPVTVVGVASDIVLNPMSESRRPQSRIYFSLDQAEVSEYVFRAAVSGTPPTLQEWRARLGEVDPELPIEAVTTVGEELRRWITPALVTAGMMGTLGGVALVLLALGVFGTLSYQVAARTREIGIRRALGADRGRVVGDTARDVARVLVAGAVGGVVLAAVVGATVDAGSIDIGSTDPLALAAACVVVLVAAVLAAVRPLRHAVRVDPLEALRGE